MKARHRARCVALEVLYEVDIADHPAGEALQYRLQDNPMDRDGVQFASHLVNGVVQNMAFMDELIAQHAAEWPFDQVAIIDRNILRISFYELFVTGETPMKVTINEAVELAKIYGSDSASRFVNGVLGTLAEQTTKIRQQILLGPQPKAAPTVPVVQ